MIRTIFIAAGAAVALVVLIKGSGRSARLARVAVAFLLPLAAAVGCLFPPKTPLIIVGWHDDNLHFFQPLKQVSGGLLSLFVNRNWREWSHLNWDDPWLLVDGSCFACGEPYAPRGTFVFALLPNGFAYTRRAPGRYDHMATPVYVSRWTVLGVAFPLAAGTSLALVCGPLRRYRRTKRGLCVDCGYDLTGNVSGRCPECGERT